MKKMIETMVFVAMFVFCGAVLGQQSKPTVQCDPKDADCIHEASDISDASQDLALTNLQAQIGCLRDAQVKFAQAAALKSATRRIAKLEEFRDSLPTDLIGQGDIQVLIDQAQTALRDDLDAVLVAFQNAVNRRIADLETRVTALEEKIKVVEADVTVVQNRVYNAEERIENLESFADWFRAISLDVGVWGTNHTIGTEGGGAMWLLMPLGLESNWRARLGGGIGRADRSNTVGWLVQFDLLARWDWFSVGPTALLLGATDNVGNRDLVPAGGLSLRADFADNWFFAQATPFIGVGLEDPDKASFTIGGLLEVGVRF